MIDGDTPCYAAAAVCEELDANNAIWEANKTIERLLKETNSSQFKLYLTGDNNFRYKLFPEYKANRLKTKRPRFLPEVRESVMANWGAIMSDGCEADDLIGIEQTAYEKAGVESVICTIDKDLDQIPGWHYNPGIKRQGEWIRPPRRYIVSPQEGMRFFYYQLLVGDNADGIKGATNIGPKKAEKILEGCTTEQEYYEACEVFFSCYEELIQNARCLRIWQHESERENLWLPPAYRLYPDVE